MKNCGFQYARSKAKNADKENTKTQKILGAEAAPHLSSWCFLPNVIKSIE